MRVFVTGASGFIGSVVVKELIDGGHHVLAMVRSDEGAAVVDALGAEVHRGDLQDLGSLRSGAEKSDGVIHTAFIHDFANFEENCDIDRRAIDTLGAALAGSDKPLIVSAGIPSPPPGSIATEDMDAPRNPAAPRVSEPAALEFVPKGVRVSVMRLPQVHDPVKQGLVTPLIAIARQQGVSAYVGEGRNRWAAVHRLAAASLYRLALEKGTAGAKYHAVGEEGVAVREIAEVIGRRLNVPVVSLSSEEAVGHFGPFAHFATIGNPASSALTQQRLGWQPRGPGLIADLEAMQYA